MLFSQFIVERLQLLNQATRGYGNQITERSLFEAMPIELQEPAQFAQLLAWGLTTGLLEELNTEQGRRFRIERSALAWWRTRSNGESTSFNKARFNHPPGQIIGRQPDDLTDK